MLTSLTAEAIHKVITAEHPSTGWLGVALTASRLIGMPLLGIAKHRLRCACHRRRPVKEGRESRRGEGCCATC